MLSLVAFVLAAQDAKLTLTMPCTTVQEVARELSLRTGRSVEAGPTVAADALIIRVKDVTLEELTAKIAEVVGGSCLKSEDRLRIVRTPDQEKEQYEDYLRLQIRALKPVIDAQIEKGRKPFDAAAAIAATIRAHPGGDPEPGVVSEAGGSTNSPLNYLAGRLLALVPPEKIAALGPGDRLVFSTHPSRVQVGLGAAGLREVDWVNKTHDAFLAAIAKKPQAKGFFSYSEVNEWASPVAKLLFIVQKSDYGTGTRMYGINKNGDRVFQSLTYLNVPQAVLATEPPKLADLKLDLPPAEEKLRQVIQGSYVGTRAAGPVPLPDDVRGMIVDFQRRDASNAIGSALLRSAAEKMGKNLVATPSSELYWVSLSYDPAKRASLFWQILSYSMDLKSTENWITVRPKNPFNTRMCRLDRPTMAKYFADLDRTRTLSVADQALAATASVWPSFSNGLGHLTNLFAPTPVEVSPLRQRALKFYATLSPRLLEAMQQEDGVAISDLTQQQRDRLTAIVYGSEDSLQQVSLQGRMLNSKEPTEALPNGLPGEARVRLRINETEVAFGSHDRMPMNSMAASPFNVAYQLTRAEAKNRRPDEVVFEKFRFGTQTVHAFKVDFGNDLRTAFSLQEVAYDRRSKPVGFEDFPESFAAEVRKEMERAKKVATPVQTGVKPPPP